MNCLNVSNFLVKGLKDFLPSTGCSGFVVGVSGGIDSALVSTLCAKTGFPVICVTLPIHQAPEQMARGAEHIQWLQNKNANVSDVNVDLTETFEVFKRSIPQQFRTELILANLRSRLRMAALYSFGHIVAGTGNKVEDFGVGFFTKYGDGGVDVSPIGDLLKTEVYELSSFFGICESILKAKPTDGLWGDNRSDEDQIGASYPELEWAMGFCEQFNYDLKAIDSACFGTMVTNRQKEVLKIYLKRHSKNAHKMKMPDIFYIPETLKYEGKN
jgi:NAD+ synthase